jgi:hypothetical protein
MMGENLIVMKVENGHPNMDIGPKFNSFISTRFSFSVNITKLHFSLKLFFFHCQSYKHNTFDKDKNCYPCIIKYVNVPTTRKLNL